MPEHVPNTVLYNKHLEPPNNLAEVPDSRGGLISGQALIDQDTGWDWLPAESEPRQGEQPQPVEFVPVEPVRAAEDLTVEELKDKLRERDLSTSGNKQELVDRLTQSISEDQED